MWPVVAICTTAHSLPSKSSTIMVQTVSFMNGPQMEITLLTSSISTSASQRCKLNDISHRTYGKVALRDLQRSPYQIGYSAVPSADGNMR